MSHTGKRIIRDFPDGKYGKAKRRKINTIDLPRLCNLDTTRDTICLTTIHMGEYGKNNESFRSTCPTCPLCNVQLPSVDDMLMMHRLVEEEGDEEQMSAFVERDDNYRMVFVTYGAPTWIDGEDAHNWKQLHDSVLLIVCQSCGTSKKICALLRDRKLDTECTTCDRCAEEHEYTEDAGFGPTTFIHYGLNYHCPYTVDY